MCLLLVITSSKLVHHTHEEPALRVCCCSLSTQAPKGELEDDTVLPVSMNFQGVHQEHVSNVQQQLSSMALKPSQVRQLRFFFLSVLGFCAAALTPNVM